MSNSFLDFGGLPGAGSRLINNQEREKESKRERERGREKERERERERGSMRDKQNRIN